MKRNLMIRRLLILTTLFTISLIIAPAAIARPAVQQAPVATVNTGALNVRSGPSVAYDSVAVIYQGAMVTLIGRNNAATWANVRLSTGQEGWLNVSLITSSVAISSLPVVAAPTLTPAAIVATGALNVRTGPGVVYDVLTAVSYGHSMTLLGRNANGSWAKMKLPSGQEGWVNTSLITANVAISSLAIVETPAPAQPPLPVAPGAQVTLRAGPSYETHVIGVVFQGLRVNAIGRNSANNWIKVRVQDNGLEGWIDARYLQLHIPLANLPILGAAPPAPTPAPTGPTAVVITGALNVRSGPGLGYSVVTTIYNGHTVTMIGRNAAGGWVKVRLTTGQEGWVNAVYISPNVAISSLPVLGTPTLTVVGVVNTGSLNVRSGPGTSYTATAVLYQGAVVGLLGRNADGNWLKVQLYSGHVGWANASYIQANVTISSLPIVS